MRRFSRYLGTKLICTLSFPCVSCKVFEAVIAWVNHDKDVRQEFMARLMEHVRLPLLPREYLVQVNAYAKHLTVGGSAPCMALRAHHGTQEGAQL